MHAEVHPKKAYRIPIDMFSARRTRMIIAVLCAGLLAFLAPMMPALWRYAAIPQSPDQPVNYVLAGVTPKYAGYHTKAPQDFRGLADTIMVLRVDPSGQLKLMSLPRDTRIQLAGYGISKLNSTNARLGPEGLMQAVADLTRLPISGYALLSLEALRNVTDALGGVDIYIAQDMQYTDTAAGLNIDLKAGQQRLNGAQAEAYSRFRHDALGDIGRVQRQQGLVRALSQKLFSVEGIVRMPQVVSVLYQDTRSNLSRTDMGYLMYAAIRHQAPEMYMLPGHFGAAFWVPEEAKIQALIENQFTRAAQNNQDPYSLSIALVNVSAAKGSAGHLQRYLRNQGYRDVWIADTRAGDPQTTMIQSTQGEQVAQKIRQDIGGGQVLVSSEGVLGADVTIRIASDLVLPDE